MLLIVVTLSIIVIRSKRRSNDTVKPVAGPQHSPFPRPTVAAGSLQLESVRCTSSVKTGEGDYSKHLSIASDCSDDYLAPNPASSDNNDNYLAPNPTASDDVNYLQPNRDACDNNDDYLVPNPD